MSNKKNGINPKISIGAGIHLSRYDEKLKFICRKLKSWKEIDRYGVCDVSGKVWFQRNGTKTFLKKEETFNFLRIPKIAFHLLSQCTLLGNNFLNFFLA